MALRPAAALAATVLLWASAFAAIRAALEHFGAGHLSVLRLLIAAVALGIVGAIRGVRLPAARDLPAIAGVAFAGMTAYQLLLNGGERTVPAGTAALLINVSPVFTAIAASVLLRERMTAARWSGVAIACAGASLIAVAGRGGLALDEGALLVLGAAVAQATFFVAQKPLLSRYGSLELTTWAMALGALMTLPFAPGLPAAIASAPAESLAAVAFLGARRERDRVRHLGLRVRAHRRLGRRRDAVLRPGGRVHRRVGLARRDAHRHDRGGRGDRAARRGARRLRRPGSAAREAEAAQHEQRLLAERAGPWQHAERDGRSVDVEERTDAVQPRVAQLGEEHDVDDDEPVRGAEPLERPPVGAEQLRRRGGVRPVAQPRTRRLQPHVRERRPQSRGAARDRVGALQRLGEQRVLVVDIVVAERREGRRVAPRPGPLPAVEQVVGAQNSATPSSGVDAWAYRRRGIRPAR